MFADLENNPKLRKFVQAAEAKHGTPLPEPIQRLMVDLAIKSTMNVQSRVDWIRRLESISKRVIESTAHESEYPLFWIYLYGVAIEFYSHLQENRELDESVDFLKPIYNSMDLLIEALSTEDISFIKYMRHSHVHISLDYIWHQAKMKDGELSAVKPLYDPDAIEISQRIIEKHGGDQQAVALDYALKIINDLRNLLHAANEAIS